MTKFQGHIVQINVNPAGGVPKQRVAQATIAREEVVGDKQRNRQVHGGPMRAVCLYSQERIAALQREGHPITPGSAGENLTIGGIEWDALVPGVRLHIGEWVELEITSYTVPCENIAGSFLDEKFIRISQKLHPGWSRLYARVIAEGEVHEGDRVVVETAS